MFIDDKILHKEKSHLIKAIEEALGLEDKKFVCDNSHKGKHPLLTPHEYEPNNPLDPKNMDVSKILEDERNRMKGGQV
jgi:hypothetical protein